jgi:outer membrane protein assembly factor BamB
LLVGAGIGLAKLDLERARCDPERLERLAAQQLPADALGASLGEWPQWRGPCRDGCSAETGLLHAWPEGGPHIIWKRPLGRGFSSVAVVGGRLFTMEQETADSSDCEAVVCLDAATGNELWRFHYPNHYEERFGSGPRSTPVVDDGLVYCVGPTGIFHCLKADTGKAVWRHDLVEEFCARPSQYGVSFSPLIEGDLVYVTPGGPDDNLVVAFDKRRGTLVWKALDDPMGYSSPIAVTAAGVRQLLVLTNTALVSLCPRNGTTCWRHPWDAAGGFNIATPVAFGNYVFISSGYGKGCALLEVATEADGSIRAHPVYEHNRMRNHFASSVRHGDHLYGFDQMDLVCMELRTGKVVWREKCIRTFKKGSLLAADGCLIVLGELGRLSLVSATPAGYQELATCQVSRNKCWTVPALANGKLYVRDESAILCLDLK